jgi:RNA polymerase sigma-70 factor (family 1)
MAALDPTGEKELLQKLIAGDEQAFELLYHAHKRKLASNLLRLLKSDELAQEVLQDLFLKIWDNRANIDPEKSFRSYLFRIAHNMVYDIFRKSARDRRIETHLMSASTELYSHIEEAIFDRETAHLLQQTIDKLPPQRKKVFTLFKIEGKSYKEISEELGISHATINEHIQKANHFLKQQLNPSSAVMVTFLATVIICNN